MVKKPFRGNYLELKVRVSYDAKTDSIHLTSKDKDLSAVRGFHLTLNKGKDAEYILRNLLEDNGLIPKEKSRIITSHAHLKDAINTDRWDQFPLGLYSNGEEAVWDSSISSNFLIAGSAGTGKSVIQRNIISHCLRHSENWALFGIDLNRVSLTPYLKYGSPIKGVATTLTDALSVVNNAYSEMWERYKIMEQNNVNNFRDLPDLLPSWMIMIDESLTLLSKSGSKTDEGKADDLLVEELVAKLSAIAPLGRAAGINLVMATQRVESNVFSKDFKDNFTTRIATGRMHQIASQLLLDNDKATHLNGAIRGRGYFQQFGQGSDFQGYFSEPDWPDEADSVSRDQ